VESRFYDPIYKVSISGGGGCFFYISHGDGDFQPTATQIEAAVNAFADSLGLSYTVDSVVRQNVTETAV